MKHVLLATAFLALAACEKEAEKDDDNGVVVDKCEPGDPCYTGDKETP